MTIQEFVDQLEVEDPGVTLEVYDAERQTVQILVRNAEARNKAAGSGSKDQTQEKS